MQPARMSLCVIESLSNSRCIAAGDAGLVVLPNSGNANDNLMIRLLISAVLACLVAHFAIAQKRSTILGDAWIGDVVSINADRREITIEFKDKNKTERFSGVLVEGYKVEMKDGSSHVLDMSEIPIGVHVRMFCKSKNQDVAGRKVKVNKIFRLDFPGRDEYSRLRDALKLDVATPVALNESGRLAETNPLKVYLVIEDKGTKDRFVEWAGKWNKLQAAKQRSIELVSSLSVSDAALVVYNGSRLLMPDWVIGADGKTRTYLYITVFLSIRKDNGLEVLWKRVLATKPEPEAEKGPIEKEMERRLKLK